VKAQRGASLVELLVAMVFLGWFAVAMSQFARGILRGTRVLEVASEAQEAARIGVQLIGRDVREAGYRPDGEPLSGVRRAAVDEIEIARDLDGDGTADDANEVVGYRLDADRRILLRSLGDAPPQPMLADVAPDGLRFTYFDASGVVLAPGLGGLDVDERARVRRVDVRLVVEIPHPDPSRASLRRTQTASVWLRNG
jgi:hypothetical protein